MFFLRLLLSLRGIKRSPWLLNSVCWTEGVVDLTKLSVAFQYFERFGIPILSAKHDTIPGGGQRRDILVERALGVSVRGSLSARTSSGSASSRNSPRQMVVEVRGAQRTTARRTVL